MHGSFRHAKTKRKLSVSIEHKKSLKGYLGLRLYANVDQLLNKMDDLAMFIAAREPDIGNTESTKASNTRNTSKTKRLRCLYKFYLYGWEPGSIRDQV